MFKVTSSEIYLSIPLKNEIVIFDKSNLINSIFSLEEKDEPMNDNIMLQPVVHPKENRAVKLPNALDYKKEKRKEKEIKKEKERKDMNKDKDVTKSRLKQWYHKVTDFMNIGNKEFEVMNVHYANK